MKYSAVLLTTILAAVLARPDASEPSLKPRNHARDVRAPYGASVRPRWNTHLNRREVPQEHSHQEFLTNVTTSLNLNNPAGIEDSVFGLLGNAAAAAGAGSIRDPECLQQATADQAFTNAKAAGDVAGMTAALVYRALERNTGAVGLASNSCTTLTAANSEIAAIQQHQDPASANAAAVNKQIALNLAVQIAAIGGDPQTALQSGTFAPGNIGDPTARGNTCDDQNDAVGCIFTQNLLVEDATADEITAAVAAGSGATSNSTAAAATAGQVVTNTAAVAAVSTDSAPFVQTATEQQVAASMMTMIVTQTVTECSAAALMPAGMTAITMPEAAAETVVNIAISLGIEININENSGNGNGKGNGNGNGGSGKGNSGKGSSGNAAIVTNLSATQTAVAIQTDSALAGATITDSAAAAATSVDCSQAITSALAAAGMAGGNLTATAFN